jgi:hypothetical protein
MSKKIDYSLKFYKGQMTNDNQETYNFYLAGRSSSEACNHIKKHVENHTDRYHIIPGENNIKNISVTEVSVENYGKSYGHEVIN